MKLICALNYPKQILTQNNSYFAFLYELDNSDDDKNVIISYQHTNDVNNNIDAPPFIFFLNKDNNDISGLLSLESKGYYVILTSLTNNAKILIKNN